MPDALQRLLAEVEAATAHITPEYVTANLSRLEARYAELAAEDHARLEARFWEVVGDVRPI